MRSVISGTPPAIVIKNTWNDTGFVLNDTPKHNDLRPLAPNTLNDRVGQGVFAAVDLDGPPRHTKINDLAARGSIQRALPPLKGSILAAQVSIQGDLDRQAGRQAGKFTFSPFLL